MSFAEALQGTATRQLLDELVAFLGRFIVFADPAHPPTVALWILHTHAITAFETTPYINVESAEKRSGKSRLLEVIAALSRDSVHVANISEAALFRMLTNEPTLLIDEVDALFASGQERTEALRGVLNAGNRRGVDVFRCVGPNQTPTAFPVFGAKCLAGIDTGRLPDTIRDRSIALRMKRKISSEQVERLLWPKVRPQAEALRDAISEWAQEHIERLAVFEPALPKELDDRTAEAWWPLLAIADHAGGDWPLTARIAATELQAVDEEESRGVQLLADVRTVFGERLAMHSRDLLEALNELDESPWGSWHEGKGLRSRDLARRLKPFAVKSKTVKIEGESLKGYHRDDLEDAWARYLPERGVVEPASPASLPSVHRAFEVTAEDEVTSPRSETSPENPHSSGEVTQVTQVTHPPAMFDVGSNGKP